MFPSCCLGGFPAEVAFYGTTLSVVDVSYCNLSSLPGAVLKALHVLQVLRARGNKLAVLPVELWRLERLEELGLSDNNITFISEDVQHLQRMQRCYLRSNLLDGPPPVGFISCSALENLDLRDNRTLVLSDSFLDAMSTAMAGPKELLFSPAVPAAAAAPGAVDVGTGAVADAEADATAPAVGRPHPVLGDGEQPPLYSQLVPLSTPQLRQLAERYDIATDCRTVNREDLLSVSNAISGWKTKGAHMTAIYLPAVTGAVDRGVGGGGITPSSVLF
jgi:hypothetical protein